MQVQGVEGQAPDVAFARYLEVTGRRLTARGVCED
jgi:hypothetical protein